MAEGGDSKPFCSEDREHEKNCKYLADGGDASPDFIPDNQFHPDESSNEEPNAAQDFIPDNKISNQSETKAVNPHTPDFIPNDNFVSDEDKYSTLPQEIGAGVEHFARGIVGPLATGAELALSKAGVPNLSAEDIKGREEANPLISTGSEIAGLGASSFVPFVGQAKVALQIASKGAELAKLAEATSMAAKLGSAAIKGAIQGGLFQASDNMSKAMLGQGDPAEGVSGVLNHGIFSSSILGGMLGLGGGAITKGLEKIGEEKGGSYLHSFLGGIGEAANGVNPEDSTIRELNPKAWENGAKWWNRKVAIIGTGAGLSAISDIKRGWNDNDLEGGLKDAALDILKGLGGNFALNQLSKPAAALILHAISNGENNPRNIFRLMDYANQANSGAQKMSKSIENLMIGGTQQVKDKNIEGAKDKINEWLDQNGLDGELLEEQYNQAATQEPQGYAEGGQVKKPENIKGISHNEALANNLPEQNIMFQTAKGRVANYLKSLKPEKNAAKLAFDMPSDQTQKNKTYNRALDIAIQPLSILDEIQKGTIVPEHINHLNSMYPEVNTSIQKKLTQRITEAQMRNEKPSSKVRQGLSLLMGTPLSGEFLPQNIQAAQTTFQMQQKEPQQAQAPTKNKKNTSTLTKSSRSFLTGNQALTTRQQGEK